MIAIWGLFCGPEWFIGGSCVSYGSLLVWGWPFPGYGGGGLVVWGWPFPDYGGGGLVVCVQGRGLGARARHLPRFILPGSFSDILLVVSILDMVYDCHF